MTSEATGVDRQPTRSDEASTSSAGASTSSAEADLLAAHRAARARRAAAPLGSEEYLEAIEKIAHIEVELARLGREASPPKI